MSDIDEKTAQKNAIRKIAALLETDGFTEEEIAIRSEKVQELLAKYKLTMSDLKLGAGAPTIRDSDFLTDRVAWVKPLLSQVARLYFCGYFFEAFPASFIRRRGLDVNNHRLLAGSHAHFFLRHSFIGKEADIVVCKMMGEYLIKAMEAVCKEEEKRWPSGERGSFRSAFMNACSARLCSRLRQRREETSANANVGGTNLPALRSLYQQAQDAYQEWLDEQGLKLKEKKNLARINHAGGARAGLAAGDRIGLDQQVGGKGGQRKLTH